MNLTGIARQQSIRAGLLTAHLTRSGGGVYTCVKHLAMALRAVPGIEVEVMGPLNGSKDLSDWEPIEPRTATRIGPAFFSYAPGLGAVLKKADLDVLHLHGLWMHPSSAALAYSRRTRRPHMISPHGMLDPWALHNSGWKKRIVSALYETANLRSAACIHALNASEAAAIRECGFNAPLCVIPNGVELPDSAAEPPPIPWWTKSAPGVKTLLYLGRLHPKKGLPKVLAAWSRLDPAIRDSWRLLIAGWDEHGHQTSLRRMAAALNIEASVTFPGPLFGEDKKAAYYHSDAFILPSVSEGLPVVVLEAWSYGKPVLMTDACNLPEGFAADAAIPIEPDLESILSAMQTLITMDDAARWQMGANGLALAKQRFAWPVIAAEMAGVYRWLSDSGPRPATVTKS
jgi:glycosyltransferase involved in cell wall biosynthesis